MASALLALLLPLFPAVALARQQQDESPPEQTGRTTDEESDEEPLQSELTEKVVVSASATVKNQQDAPAAVDVLDGEDLEQQPGEHLIDHLRRVPGLNVVQFGSRDVNIASRSATGGINNTTLALTDGRSLYQDFLGFVWTSTAAGRRSASSRARAEPIVCCAFSSSAAPTRRAP